MSPLPLRFLTHFFGLSVILAAQNPQKLPTPMTAGEDIQSAARAAALDRTQTGGIDIISDTYGVDFGPYFEVIMPKIRKNWYSLISEPAKTRKGKLAIEFAVTRDGRITKMKLVQSSGDTLLDRPAWGAITLSDPLPALPKEFPAAYLSLRFRFLYNPASPDAKHAGLIEETANSPNYPQHALDAKKAGLVRLEGVVGSNGKIKDLKVLEGDPELGEACVAAISKWRFRPAMENGVETDEVTRLNVVFRLQGREVRATVVWPEAAPTTP